LSELTQHHLAVEYPITVYHDNAYTIIVRGAANTNIWEMAIFGLRWRLKVVCCQVSHC